MRQGGVLSTFFYLVYINDLLVALERSNFGSTVMSVKAGNPSFADDIALIASTPLYLQKLIDIVYIYCRHWKMDISAPKSNVIVFTIQRTVPVVGILYGERFIEQTKSVSHLGIRHNHNVKCNLRILERLQKARNAFFAMSALGVHTSA